MLEGKRDGTNTAKYWQMELLELLLLAHGIVDLRGEGVLEAGPIRGGLVLVVPEIHLRHFVNNHLQAAAGLSLSHSRMILWLHLQRCVSRGATHHDYALAT